MKKTIASLALMTAATSAQALIGPDPTVPQPEPKTYCLGMYQDQDGTTWLGTCDESAANERYGLELKDNGCAEGQAAFVSVDVEIAACPTFVQL